MCYRTFSSGKSTLIRCVNYLEQPTDGVISYRGENVLECFKNLPLYRTKVGMVFQQFNLFNNMTVLENCVVGQVKVLGKKSEEAKAIAMKYLEHVGMQAISMQSRISFPEVRSSVWLLPELWLWSRKYC